MNSNLEMSFQVERPHALPADAVLEKLRGTPEGLTIDEAARRLEAVGPNRLPAPPKEGLLKRFFKHFHDLLIYILIAAAAITAVLGHWVDTGVILAVVIINATIGFIQEGKAEQALEGIRKMLSLNAHARRNGEWVEVEADDLVPGDVVRLRSGDRVPADLRLLETVNLRVEESALTGESVPAEKNPELVAEDAGVGDRHCMAYSGTMVAAGARAVVSPPPVVSGLDASPPAPSSSALCHTLDAADPRDRVNACNDLQRRFVGPVIGGTEEHLARCATWCIDEHGVHPSSDLIAVPD